MVGAGDGTPTKGEVTRHAILAAAIERFGRAGFRATSVADIARTAGVGGTVPYTYFPNKEALFLAALDEDAAGVISEGLTAILASRHEHAWRQSLITTLVSAVEQHPLARRVLAGLEPHATYRMSEIPALTELRKVVAERIRADQLDGTVRPDIDPVALGSGAVTIILALLMSVIQFGPGGVAEYGPDVFALFEAAFEREPPPVDRPA